jgi:hypothetical protein
MRSGAKKCNVKTKKMRKERRSNTNYKNEIDAEEDALDMQEETQDE